MQTVLIEKSISLSPQKIVGAGLWLTASNKKWHETDGMFDGLITGTSQWQPIKLVLDIP